MNTESRVGGVPISSGSLARRACWDDEALVSAPTIAHLKEFHVV